MPRRRVRTDTPWIPRDGQNPASIRDCSKDTGFIQPVHNGVMRAFVDGLRFGLHATYPALNVRESALACARGRHVFATFHRITWWSVPRSSKASGGEDLQIEEPVCGG